MMSQNCDFYRENWFNVAKYHVKERYKKLLLYALLSGHRLLYSVTIIIYQQIKLIT